MATTTPELRLAWVDVKAARHACERWHYAGRMPSGKLVKIGVWEGDRFVGVIIFGRGATPRLGSPYGLDQTEVCELVRVALRDHVHPVTAMVARALRMLKASNPGLRLVVSFADTGQGHHGGIYQAGNWIYVGSFDHPAGAYRVRGEIVHPKTLHARYGRGGQSLAWLHENVDPNAARVPLPDKHRFLMPLDRAMRRQVLPLAKPYPRPVVST